MKRMGEADRLLLRQDLDKVVSADVVHMVPGHEGVLLALDVVCAQQLQVV